MDQGQVEPKSCLELAYIHPFLLKIRIGINESSSLTVLVVSIGVQGKPEEGDDGVRIRLRFPVSSLTTRRSDRWPYCPPPLTLPPRQCLLILLFVVRSSPAPSINYDSQIPRPLLFRVNARTKFWIQTQNHHPLQGLTPLLRSSDGSQADWRRNHPLRSSDTLPPGSDLPYSGLHILVHYSRAQGWLKLESWQLRIRQPDESRWRGWWVLSRNPEPGALGRRHQVGLRS